MRRIVSLFLVVFLSSMLSVRAQTLKAWLSAGDASMEASRYAEAIEYYKKALEFETDNPTVYFKMAEACRHYNDYERAAAWYAKIVMGDHENRYPDALFRYAEMKKYLGMYDESARLYDRYATLHMTDTTYFAIKARNELSQKDTTLALSNRKIEVEVTNAGTPVNTTYSDFAAGEQGDTVLYFSSLRFLYEQSGHGSSYYVSRLLKSELKTNKNQQPFPLAIQFNEASSHNCNLAFSPDYHLIFFSRCMQDDEGILDCSLLYSKWENGVWSKPVPVGGGVNMEGYTATQPAVAARGAEGYTLYFISDRPGGQGKLDVWQSDFNTLMQFTPPVNAGPAINTFDDEMSPFFDTPAHTLYFSSYGHAGMGGMDIFQSELQNGTFSRPENLGPGYNTPVNDVYFTLNRDGKTGTLTSNRIGSLYIRSKTCCYDIWYYKIPERDTTTVVIAEVIKPPVVEDVKTLSTRSYYDQFLPMEIYFDNDEPDKRTMAITTNKEYESLYNNYLDRLPEYISKYTANLTGDQKTIAEQKVTDFFETKVSVSWQQLNSFCSKLEKALNKGITIEIEIRGRASPLARTDYNVNLSKRRISSLINFMNGYEGGVLKPFLENGSLKITEVAAGEMLASEGISDELTDKRNSVYSPAAAAERRIELIDIKLKEPGK